MGDFFEGAIVTRHLNNSLKEKIKTPLTVWHRRFAGSNFCDFAFFSTIRAEKSSAKKFHKNFFRQKILQWRNNA